MPRSPRYAAAVLALALAACGGGDPTPPAPGATGPPAGAASEPTETAASDAPAAAPEFSSVKELARASAVQTADLGPGWGQDADAAGFAPPRDRCAAKQLRPVKDDVYAGTTSKHKDAEAYVSSAVIVFPEPRHAKAYIRRRNLPAWAECERGVIEKAQRQQNGVDDVTVRVGQMGRDPALGVDAFAQFDLATEGAENAGRIVRYAFRTQRVVMTVSWDAALSADDPNELDSRTFEDILNAVRAARKRLTGSG